MAKIDRRRYCVDCGQLVFTLRRSWLFMLETFLTSRLRPVCFASGTTDIRATPDESGYLCDECHRGRGCAVEEGTNA